MQSVIRVLNIEACLPDTEAILSELRAVGFEPHLQRVETESEFLECLQNDSGLDLILAEHTLPHFSAKQALTLLRERGKDIPLIVVAREIDVDGVVECIKEGAIDCLLKDRPGRLGKVAKRVLVERKQQAEKQRTEKALIDSQKRNRALLNAIPDLMFRISRDGIFLDYKAANPAKLALPPEQFLGRSIYELFPTLAPQAMHYVEQALETGNVQVFEYQMELRGVVYDYEARHAPSGKDEVMAIVRDITERKQREREVESIGALAKVLRAANTRAEAFPILLSYLRSLFHVDSAMIATHNPDTGEVLLDRIEGVNAHLTGVHFSAEAGSAVHDILRSGKPFISNDPKTMSDRLGAEFLGEIKAVGFFPLVVQEQAVGLLGVGRIQPLSETDVRILDGISDMVAIALYRIRIVETLEQRVMERTVELEQANERLQELDRLKSKFVSDVSHELRSPVSNLNMRLYLLEHDNPEKVSHHIAVLKEQVNRLNSLIENILDLSRLDMGSAQATFAPVDLNAIVEQIVNTYSPRIEANKLMLTLDLAHNLPLVYGVSSQLTQVITNLFVNAINYTPAGEIRIYTYQAVERNQVCIIIQDTGIGIHPTDLPHLFDRFYRGENARQASIAGTGLGLGIVKEIVEQHSGVIDVESEIGVGSIFRVCLPRYRPVS